MTAVGNDAAVRLRDYQQEMLEASMKENIIVAMDTGSGKTNVAVARIIRELERCPPNKLVWFLAPTVALCVQQHYVVSSQIPAVRSKTITGLDKVDRWTNQDIWDTALNDVRIVLSTHQVLFDGLAHGFVRISNLALLVFDEAHHCRNSHPANKILLDFYHPALAGVGPDGVPHILGLTASPIMRPNPRELADIESNMNAVCKTPREHRSQLMEYTHRPDMLQLLYTPLACEMVDFDPPSTALHALLIAYSSWNIEDDPYVKKLRVSPFAGKQLTDILAKGKTYCSDQLKRFVNRSFHICEELGGWPTDYFISASIKQLQSSVGDSSVMADWDVEEKTYLVDFLSKVTLPDIRAEFWFNGVPSISPKLELLIDFLDQMYNPDMSGIIFVKQRATVGVMQHVLSVHPVTKDRFRCAPYVGYSGNGSRNGAIGDLHNPKMQGDTLADFKSGRKNLVIATDVLEEGIDISACSLVICYDKPPNLKSFVQRRGRARRVKSTFAVMIPEDDEIAYVSQWRELEEEMIKAYQEDARQHEMVEEDEEVVERFLVESTGALLTADTAISHLYHFCSVLPSQQYVDTRPAFSLERDDVAAATRATVILPTCVHPRVRHTQGKRWWRSKKAAVKEAAFHAYKALYEFGLLNDNLLPLTHEPELQPDSFAEMPSKINVSEQYDPWVDLAYSWSSPDIHQRRITVRQNGVLVEELSMALTVPAFLPELGPLTLFWDQENTFIVSFAPPERVPMARDSIEHLRAITATYLHAAGRMANAAPDFIALFAPDIPECELEGWITTNQGCDPALDIYPRKASRSLSVGIVRNCMQFNQRYLFRKWLEGNDDSIVELECEPFPRRRNLLSRQTLAQSPTDDASRDVSGTHSNACILSAEACTIDKLPFSQSIFGLFISAIIERLEVALVAAKLCSTVLKDIGFSSIRHVITALTTPVALAAADYQRYEFFGDSVLKFTASCQLFFEYPNWHEGYLSQRRDQIVQNENLARAALDVGLDQYILNKTFRAKKWSAPLISERINATQSQRELSKKVLADVVEAVIGAAYMDGGMGPAQMCITRFLPIIDLKKLHPQSLHSPDPEAGHVMNRKIFELIGYNFNNESLLVEALTHPSCHYDLHTQSYQRLEFLGDAILDIIIVTALSKSAVEIPPGEMSMIKAAIVNANLLAFCCMHFTLTDRITDIVHKPDNSFATIPVDQTLSLWQFLRCQDQVLKSNRDATLTRYVHLRPQIANALLHADEYPWALLAQMNAEKFFSDLIESILGAIFVDSNGDLSACEAFAERIGLLPYLRRILAEKVNFVHPKQLAQKLARANPISFVLEKQKNGDECENSGHDVKYRCAVTRNNVHLVVVEDCISREEAEVKAALAVVGNLRERP